MAIRIDLLFIGDVVGKPGIEAVDKYLGTLKEKYHPNFIILNGENVTHGKGITEPEAEHFFEMGVDVITTGNHIWDNWKSRPLLQKNDKILRPFNYPWGNPGKGFIVLDKEETGPIAVLQLQGRTFMQTIDCPFRAADSALKIIKDKTENIIVDFHADATAEKISMAWHLDGKVSALIGTHTHIQTADASIFPNGMAYISDTGMTGPYDSVVGMRKDVAIKRFTLQTPHKYEMASGDIKISGVYVCIDTLTHQAEKIEPFIIPAFEREIRI